MFHWGHLNGGSGQWRLESTAPDQAASAKNLRRTTEYDQIRRGRELAPSWQLPYTGYTPLGRRAEALGYGPPLRLVFQFRSSAKHSTSPLLLLSHLFLTVINPHAKYRQIECYYTKPKQ